MDIPITEIGVGGAVALIIIREVFNFMKEKKINGDAGITRSEFNDHKTHVQYQANCKEIVKRFDDRAEMQEKRFDKIDKNLDEVKGLIVNGGK